MPKPILDETIKQLQAWHDELQEEFDSLEARTADEEEDDDEDKMNNLSQKIADIEYIIEEMENL